MDPWLWRNWPPLGSAGWIALAVALVGTGLVAILSASSQVRRIWGRHQRRRVARRAAGAEHSALSLLRSHGYTVLETQVEQAWPVQRGTDNMQVRLRADARVERGGQQFIAEIKSSSLVADLRHGPTRRQLLEYAVAYRTDGVLLVDMRARRIEQIIFPDLVRIPPAGIHLSHSLGLTLLALCFLAGAWAASIVLP